MLEANLTTPAEQLTVMDYFFYGRKHFSQEELEFLNSKKFQPHCVRACNLSISLEFLDSEPVNNMLDDMIANAVDNFDNPRKHVTYDDRFYRIQTFKTDKRVTSDGRMAHVDTWHSFIDWALFYSGIPGGEAYHLKVSIPPIV